MGHTPPNRALEVDGKFKVLVSDFQAHQGWVSRRSLIDKASKLRVANENTEVESVHP